MATRENAAAERISRGVPVIEAIDVTDPDAWLDLDTGIRVLRPDALADRAGDRPRDLVLVLCHRDARVRESALERVPAHPELLPLLVIRTADRAAPVRDRARALLPGLLAATAPEDLVPLTALVLRVARRERGGFAREALTGLLRTSPLTALEPLLTAPDRNTRRVAHRVAVERGLLSAARLARTAAADDDIVVRNVCAGTVLSLGTAGDDVIAPLLESRHPAARSAGVTALCRAGRHGEARPYLTDRSGTVRACARYALRQGGTDPLPLYRALCADPNDQGIPPGAPIGLAECGGTADAELLWPLTSHPDPGVRARAVAGLRLLDRTDTERLRPLLDDPVPAVARQAATALLPSADRLPEKWLVRRLASRRRTHTRRAAFQLLRARGGVAVLRAAVRLLDDHDPLLRTQARTTILQWEPPASGGHDPAEVAALLDRCTPVGEPDVLRLRRRADLHGPRTSSTELPRRSVFRSIIRAWDRRTSV